MHCGGHSFSQIWQATQRSVPIGSSAPSQTRNGKFRYASGSAVLSSGYCVVTKRLGSWKLPTRFLAVTARPWRSPVPSMVRVGSAVDLAEDDVDAAEDDDRVGHGVAEAQVLEEREVDERGRAHPVSVGVRAAVADQVEADLALRALDSAVDLPLLRAEAAEPGLRVHDRSVRDVPQRLLEYLDGLPHLEDPDHVAVVRVAVGPERHAEIEARVEAVAVHLAHVVVDARRAQHRAGDAGADGERRRQPPDALGAGHEDLVSGDELLVLVEEPAEAAGQGARGIEPSRGRVRAATAEALVVAHHPGAAQGLEKVEDLLALAERVHERGAACAAVLQEEAREARVVEEAGELGEDDAQVLRALRHGLAR